MGGKRGRPQGAMYVAFLDEWVARDESVYRAMCLSRPTYTVAYLAIAQPDGRFRVTHRGTGMYDYFFDSLVAYDQWEVDRHLRLLARRFNLQGPTVATAVRYYSDREEALAALMALPAA